ncbi:hypothetical protein ACFW2V_13655 [Streptomyces sp. NPDC058947]|uniref:hypothetical protein n=1 Tax=Streptomyces sp. NPDC058947 TaxID=3346675 RepID=UPI0036A725CC
MSGKEGGLVGPAGLRWTYLRPYGSGDRYSADLYRPHDGTDSVEFVKTADGVPEHSVGEYSLDFDRKKLDEVIAELIWLRDNWGEAGRG